MVDIIGQFSRGLEVGERIANRPQRDELAELALSRQRQSLSTQETQAAQQEQQFGQGQVIQRARIINQSARALKAIDPQSRGAAYQRLEPRLQELGIDTSQFVEATFDDPQLDEVIASTEGLIRDPSQLTASMRERQQLIKEIEPFINERGQFDADKANAKALSAARSLNIISKPGATTKEERIAEDPELTEKVAGSQAKIQGAIAEEKAIAKARGENFNELRASKAALPGITEVVGQLKILAEDATWTLGGRAFNEVAKGFGFQPKGDTSRASMVAIVDNQVLPLLRPIFGAAFTKAEGDALKAALVNPDSTPDSRKAQLDAFLTQMQRNIESKQAQAAPAPGQQDQQIRRIRFDSQGNIIQ